MSSRRGARMSGSRGSLDSTPPFDDFEEEFQDDPDYCCPDCGAREDEECEPDCEAEDPYEDE